MGKAYTDDARRLKHLQQRFDAACDELEQYIDHQMSGDHSWSSHAILSLIREGLLSLQRSLKISNEEGIGWDNLWIEAQYPIVWDWDRGVPDLSVLDQLRLELVDAPPLEELKLSYIFQVLSRRAVNLKTNGMLTSLPPRIPILGEDLELENTPGARAARLTDELRQACELVFKGEAQSEPYEGSLVVEFQPLVIDEDTRSAYYPVEFGIVLTAQGSVASAKGQDPIVVPEPERWSSQEKKRLWQALFGALDCQEQDIPGTTKRASSGSGARSSEGLLSLDTALGFAPKVIPKRRSVMSPVPVPRGGVKHAAGLALTRGLGRMFSEYDKIPDLDIQGEIATRAAERIFWDHLREFMAHAVPKERDSHWTCEELGDKKVLVLSGVTEPEARDLWVQLTQAMNKGQGGPGIHVAAPQFEMRTYFERSANQVVSETRIALWPDDALVNQDGWYTPPVRFRTEGSPGYVALLDQCHPQPYFADGWLWIPRSNEREGFRIGGLSTLLFPEGRVALERMKRRQLIDYESELNRLFQQPSLFQDHDTRAVQQLRAAIRRVQLWLRDLSTYDISHDLILCIFETFFWQRDAWIDQKLRLPDGREVDTTPWRVVYLDPKDLRIRLDPLENWGPNWRHRLFQKLEALTTFERQTRTLTGRKIDVGDRFLGRVIDGYQGVAEGTAPEADSGLGLTRVLKRAGALPVDAFFVEVSIDFMERLVTWAVDESGKVHWGIEAAKAAERAALVHYPDDPKKAKKAAEAKRLAARTSPYFDHSPRLLTLGNLEGWPIERKLLANVLLQEITPHCEIYETPQGKKRKRRRPNKHGGKEAIATIEGEEFVSCNGMQGHGYRVQTWVAKAGYEKRRGRNGWDQIFDCFLTDLKTLAQAIGLQIQLKDYTKDTKDAIKKLEALRKTPGRTKDLIVRAYLPMDLENRLRERLAEEGIDAIDAEEFRLPLDLPATPGGLSPTQIREARKRAKMTQAQLAKRIGITQGLLSQWEHAKEPISQERMSILQGVLRDYL